jgi:hypothetical protein
MAQGQSPHAAAKDDISANLNVFGSGPKIKLILNARFEHQKYGRGSQMPPRPRLAN